VNVENEIENIILTGGPIRTDRLVQKLIENNPKKRGYSQKTLYRKISTLKGAGRISEVPPEEYSSYNITETDGRAIYLTVPIAEDRKKHIDMVISDIPKGNAIDQYQSFLELLLYKGYYALSPSQVDIIGAALLRTMKDENGGDIVYMALQILHEVIIEKDTPPLDSMKLRERLHGVLGNFRDISKYRPNVRYAIQILGYFDDHAVIEQLAYDAPKLVNDENLINEYTYPEMRAVIEHHRSELYEIEKSFVRNGDTQTAKVIHQIRKTALEDKQTDYDPSRADAI